MKTIILTILGIFFVWNSPCAGQQDLIQSFNGMQTSQIQNSQELYYTNESSKQDQVFNSLTGHYETLQAKNHLYTINLSSLQNDTQDSGIDHEESFEPFRALQQEELSIVVTAPVFLVSATTASYTFSGYGQTAAEIYANSENFAISWSGKCTPYTTAAQSFLQIYDSSNFQVISVAEDISATYSTKTQNVASVNYYGGELQATWYGQWPINTEVIFEKINLQGVISCANTQITSSPNFVGHSQFAPRLATLGSINMIVWTGTTTTYTSKTELFGMLVNAQTCSFGTPILLSVNTGSYSFTGYSILNHFINALTQSSKFLIVFNAESSQSPSNSQIFGQVFDPNSETFAASTFLVSQNVNGFNFGYPQNKPISFEFGAYFGITWFGKSSKCPTLTCVYNTIYSSSTYSITTNTFIVSVNTPTYTFSASNQGAPFGMGLGGLYVIAWSGPATGFSQSQIFATILNSESTVVPAFLVSADANSLKFSTYSQSVPAIASISNSSFIVTWDGPTNVTAGLTQIYAIGLKISDFTCVDNTECPSQYFSKCDLGSFTCVPCLESSDCSAQGNGYSCLEGVCIGSSPAIAIPEYIASVSTQVGVFATQVCHPGTTSAIVRPIYLNMFIFLKFLNIKYPSSVLSFFDYSEPVSLEIDVVKYPSEWTTESDQYESPSRYYQYNVKALFLENCWPLIISFCIAIGMTLTVFLFAKYRNYFKNIVIIVIIDTLSDLFIWNFIVAYFMESGFELSFYYIVQIQSVISETSNSVMIGSFIFSTLAIVGTIAVWIFVLYPKTLARKKLSQNSESEELPQEHKQFSVLHGEFKIDKEYKILFNLVFAIRYVLYNIFVTLPFQQPILQIVFLILLNFGMLSYMVFGSPSKVKRKNIETIFYEAALCLVNIMALAMQIIDEADSQATTVMGDIMLMIYNFIFIVCMSFTVLELIAGGKELYLARLKTIRELKQAKTHPEIHRHAEVPRESVPIVVHVDEESPSVRNNLTQVNIFRKNNLNSLSTSRMILQSERVNNSLQSEQKKILRQIKLLASFCFPICFKQQ